MTTDVVRVIESMSDAQSDHLLSEDKRQRTEAVITAIYRDAEHLKQQEVNEAIHKLEVCGDITDSQRDAVEAMAETIVAQILSVPTKSLREAVAEDDWPAIDTALRLFGPEFETGDREARASDSNVPEVANDDD
jgi:glutamyl-tRNA reductase